MRQDPLIASRLETPSRDTVRLVTDRRTWIDIAAFMVKCERASDLAARDETAAYRSVKQAINLYNPEFLIGIDEEWALIERTRLENLWLDAVLLAARLAFSQKDYASAEAYAQISIRHEGFREEAHSICIQAAAFQGDRLRAQKMFADFRTLLLNELSVKPSFSLDELLGQQGEIGSCQSGRPLAIDAGDPIKLRSNLKNLRQSLDKFEQMLGPEAGGY
ncbi:MAG: bacterial transcriptional activator domain-containing protein [Pseudomonadota bacterium]